MMGIEQIERLILTEEIYKENLFDEMIFSALSIVKSDRFMDMDKETISILGDLIQAMTSTRQLSHTQLDLIIEVLCSISEYYPYWDFEYPVVSTLESIDSSRRALSAQKLRDYACVQTEYKDEFYSLLGNYII